MAAGDINDPLSEIPGVALQDRVSSAGAPGAGFGIIESIDGVLNWRFGTGDAVPLAALVAGLLSALTEKAAPAAGDWLLLQDTADGDALKKVDVDNLPGGGGGGLWDAIVVVADVKAQNTASQTVTAGDWRKHDLQTEITDSAGIASLASDQLTLEAGTYDVEGFLMSIACGSYQARLYDTTGSTVLATGMVGYSNTDRYGGPTPAMMGSFTLAVQSVLEFQIQVTVGAGVGQQGNFTSEIYALLRLMRRAA